MQGTVAAAQVECDSGAAGSAVVQAREVRVASVEALRALAALGVMVAHIYIEARGSRLGLGFRDRLIVVGGGYGVFLFFALSGYLLYWPFARRDFGAGGSLSVRRYALNRALRILPLYYVVLATLLIVQEGGGSARQWLMFATFSENFGDDTLFAVDAPMWSLVIELHFYLALPLLALAVSRLSSASMRTAALALGALAVASLALRLGSYSFDPAGADAQLRFSLPSMFFFFVSGMLLALARLALEAHRSERGSGTLPRAEVWVAAAAALWLLACWRPQLEPLIAFACFLFLGALVLPLRRGPLLSWLDWRPLALLGVASYSLYLWHLPVIEALGRTSWAPDRFLGLLAVAGAVCIAVGLVSYRLVEEPFLRLRTRWAAARP